MENFVLSCCSTADLSLEHFQNRNIHYICFHYELNGTVYPDDLGQSMPFDVFYEAMTKGAETKTFQVNVAEFEAYFETFLQEGKDILHLCLSSGITRRVKFCQHCKGYPFGEISGAEDLYCRFLGSFLRLRTFDGSACGFARCRHGACGFVSLGRGKQAQGAALVFLYRFDVLHQGRQSNENSRLCRHNAEHLSAFACGLRREADSHAEGAHKEEGH